MLRKLNERAIPTHNAAVKLSDIKAKVFDKAHGLEQDVYLIVNSGEEPGYDLAVNVGLYTSRRLRDKDTLLRITYTEGPNPYTDRDYDYNVIVDAGYDGGTISPSHTRLYGTVGSIDRISDTFDRILKIVFRDIDLEELIYDEGSIGELQDFAIRTAKKCGLNRR